jgi:ABC-type transport system substrate-binding protein
MSDNRSTPTNRVSRRDLVKGAAGIAAVAVAGCTGPGGGGGSQVVDPVQERVTVDPEDIQEGGTFRTAVGTTNIDTFDFPYSSSASASNFHGLLYEGMITTDAAGVIYPWLAQSVEQVEVQDVTEADYTDYMTTVPYRETEDGSVVVQSEAQIVVRDPDNPSDPSPSDQARVLTVEEAPDAVEDGTFGMHFRFQLHEGVTFHNGAEMTASDVVASYERIQNSPLAGQVYDSLLDIQADGDYTVDIYVQIPDAAAIRELGGLSIYPEETATLPARAMDPRQGNTPVGSGPFELAEFESEQFARFTRFDDYWFDTELKADDWYDGPSEFPNGPVVDEVDIAFIPDDSTRSAALQEGELDMAYGLSASNLTDYSQAEGFRTAATDGAGYTFLQFPVNSEPWDDKRMRQAVNHLIPRQQISEDIFQGWESPAWTPLPPVARNTGSTDYEAMVERHRPENEFDPDQADELAQAVIDERGLETPIEVTLETNSDNDDRVRTMELITESLNQKEYFDAELQTREFLTFVGDLLSGQYPQKERLAFIGLSGGFNPHGYAKSVHSPENFMGCCNFQNIDFEELNQALADARYGVEVAQDPELRRERYEEVWDLVLELNANSYGTHSTVVGTVDSSRVKGFNTFPSSQSVIPYGLHNPTDQQITYLEQG